MECVEGVVEGGDMDGGDGNRCVSRLFLSFLFLQVLWDDAEWVEGVVEGGDAGGGNGIKVRSLFICKGKSFLFL